MQINKFDLIIIGGGASGLFASCIASDRGKKVLIIEKNKVLGKKLALTGGGRCNITNAKFDTHAFLENFKESKKFLFSPFSRFSVSDSMDYFENTLNLPLKIEKRDRVFPKSNKATDVIDVMISHTKKNGTKILLNTTVTKLITHKNKVTSVICNNSQYFAEKFILSTGGLAAPETGSTGDGFKFLKELGHTILKPNPNLIPLKTNSKWVHSLSGTTLDNIKISFIQNDKVKIKKTGRLLFTHFGISGPMIINSSFEVKKLLKKSEVIASIDLFPDLQEHLLDKKLVKLFQKNTNKLLSNVLVEILPKSIITQILSFNNLKTINKIINSITKNERKLLVTTMKNLKFPITGTLGLDKAIIADGGIKLEEVNFKNMSSKLYPNLYITGDLLSINRPSGGYSLQLCWTTAFVASKDV